MVGRDYKPVGLFSEDGTLFSWRKRYWHERRWVRIKNGVDPSLGDILSEGDVYESILIQSKYEKVVQDAEMDGHDYVGDHNYDDNDIMMAMKKGKLVSE